MTLTVCIVVFVLAMFLGREVITKVPATLHTPLMSGSNAISGITVVGAIVAVAVFGRSTEETNTMAAVPRRRRGLLRLDQRLRRFCGHRPHAADVQEALIPDCKRGY
jgi:hypothetical protein